MASGAGEASGGGSERASGEKRVRGPSQLATVVNQTGKHVEFDAFGRPIINRQTTKYPSHLGILVRRNVPITCLEWSQVEDDVKEKIWNQIQVNNMVLSSQASKVEFNSRKP